MVDQKRQTKAEQSEATIAKFMAIAKEMFATQGYAAVATEEMVQRAGVTRGALYHHFGSKEGLFKAVAENIQQEIARQISDAARNAPPDPWDQLLAGCRAFLTACLDPAVHRILMIDAPAVLGWEAWREMDSRYGTRMLQHSLINLSRKGLIKPLSLEALTHLLNGALTEATLWLAQAENPAQALEESMTALAALLDGLRMD